MSWDSYGQQHYCRPPSRWARRGLLFAAGLLFLVSQLDFSAWGL